MENKVPGVFEKSGVDGIIFFFQVALCLVLRDMIILECSCSKKEFDLTILLEAF